jgi:hypothetical protein
MKHIILIMLVLISSATIGNSKNIPVSGEWLLTKIEKENKVQEIYAPVTFQENGDFMAMGMKMGTWSFDKKARVVKIVSQQFKVANGDNKVVKLENGEMLLESALAKMYFRRISREKIARENAASGLIGTWRLATGDNQLLQLLTFKAPDSLLFVEKEPGVTSRASGSWIYNKNDNSLIVIMMGHRTDFRGLNKITMGKDAFTLENKGKTIKATKEKTTGKIEHLNFKESDFYDADGNFKYENDEEKLPWNDHYALLDYLKTVHQLTYKYSVLIPDAHVFKSKTFHAGVTMKNDNQKVCVDYIFNGYDKAHLPDDTALPPNCFDVDSYNKLFPLKEADFRIAGKEQITTPAGTFQCTVIEALGDFDTLQKLWMIDDKPGVYAKIIMEKKDPDFGYYKVYELQEIK